VQIVYRPTVPELVAASRELLRLRGLLARLRGLSALLIVAGPLGLVLGQWLFSLYAVAMGVTVLLVQTPWLLRRAVRTSPLLSFDTTMDVTEDGITVVGPTASSRNAWAHYSGWSLIPEGLLLMHAMQQRIYSFVPRSALAPEALDVITRHVPRHPRARADRP
jgi:hypothetical protein